MTTPATVDAYLAAQPDERRPALEELRAAILAAAPGATESIAYQMPAYRVNGRFLVSFAAFKGHTSLFPASGMVMETLGEELAPYYQPKATIRFPAGRPILLDLVTRIVETRLEEVAGPGAR
jgi:uncharacterized protein YdhG (YjbR/CyaY superfamily)